MHLHRYTHRNPTNPGGMALEASSTIFVGKKKTITNEVYLKEQNNSYKK